MSDDAEDEGGLASTARQVLDDLIRCGSSEGLAVGDCLKTIAENGDEQAETDYLVGCAAEIAGWALEFIRRVRGVTDEDFDKTLLQFMLYAQDARSRRAMEEICVRFVAADVQSTFAVTTDEGAEFLCRNKRKIEDRLTELGNDVIDAFGQMDGLEIVDYEDDPTPDAAKVKKEDNDKEPK